MVTANVVGLYPSISHDAGLDALRKALDNRENKNILTDNLTKMAEFVLKNNFFEYNGKVKKQISGTAIGTKFVRPYTCIFMDHVETWNAKDFWNDFCKRLLKCKSISL